MGSGTPGLRCVHTESDSDSDILSDPIIMETN